MALQFMIVVHLVPHDARDDGQPQNRNNMGAAQVADNGVSAKRQKLGAFQRQAAQRHRQPRDACHISDSSENMKEVALLLCSDGVSPCKGARPSHAVVTTGSCEVTGGNHSWTVLHVPVTGTAYTISGMKARRFWPTSKYPMMDMAPISVTMSPTNVACGEEKLFLFI